jgi:sugar/nucleoside kinase (ribokinase family)
LPPAGVAAEPGALVEVGPLIMQPGGSVFNTGWALATLGVSTTAIAHIGDDPLGRYVHTELAARGITPHLTPRPTEATPYSLVIESATRDRAFLHHVGAAASFTGDAVGEITAPLFHLGYPPVLPALIADDGRKLTALLRRVHHTGVSTSMDLAVVDAASPVSRLDWVAILTASLPYTDVISPSIDDLVSIGVAAGSAPADIEEATRWLLDRGAAVAMVSAGRAGAFLATASRERLDTAGRAVAGNAAIWNTHEVWIDTQLVDRPVSTNGAGDTLTAGLLYGLLQQWNPADTGYFAARLAAARIQGEPLTTAREDCEHTNNDCGSTHKTHDTVEINDSTS